MKTAKALLPLIFLALLPILLIATQTADLSVLFSTDFSGSFREAVMDTDSTLCLYNYSSSWSPTQQSLTVWRIHPDGLIEPEQTLYSFPGNIVTDYSFYQCIHSEIEGNSIRFIFGNHEALTLLIVSGTEVTSYSTALLDLDSIHPPYLLFNDRLIYRDQDQIKYWDYIGGGIYPLYSFHPEANQRKIGKLGTDRLLISQASYYPANPELFPVMLVDSQMNLSSTNLSNKAFELTYCFDENHIFGYWTAYEPYEEYCNGVMAVNSNDLSLNIWSSSGPMDPWGEGWGFLLALPGNLHVCIYHWGSFNQEYHDIRIYYSDGQGNIILHTGFPQINSESDLPFYMSLYQNRFLLIYYVEGQLDFKLADLNSQEWIPVNGSPMGWPEDPNSYVDFMHSNNYIYRILKRAPSPGLATISCMKLDISVSTDDPVAAPPVLKAYPNPFRSTVKLEFDSTDICPAVDIYNLRGQKVRTLPSQPDGTLWDGKDASGNRLSSGIYFARPQGGKQKTLKLLKLGD